MIEAIIWYVLGYASGVAVGFLAMALLAKKREGTKDG